MPISQVASPSTTFRDSAFGQNKQDAIHRWVPWIAGFSAGFVADSFQHYLPDPTRRDIHVLEPFAGVGTTLVEGLLCGYNVTGFEVNPFAALASRVKSTAFKIEPHNLLHNIIVFEHKARQRTATLDRAFANGDDPSTCYPEPKSSPPPSFRSRVAFFSPTVERKVLHCLDIVREIPDTDVRDLALLAFGSIIVSVSNYSYEPSLSSRVAAGKPDVPNADVVSVLTTKLRAMYDDLLTYRDVVLRHDPLPQARVLDQTSLNMASVLPAACTDIVVTSPPYLNNYHYIRNTRPHLFWLDFVARSSDLKAIETANFGKYWQTVRDAPLSSLNFQLPDLELQIGAIAAKHPEKGVYGGKGWANYATEYFNDCYQLCTGLRHVLKENAVAVVVL